MGHPKEYYYYSIRKWIMMKEDLPDDRLQMAIFNNAYRDALKETAKLPNGELRLKAIDEILIKRTRTYEGVAQEVHYSANTVKGWIASFVNLVGRKAGF